ncbi:MAG: metal-dependent hydrolase [Planctomycetia bacterium]|nr:metal-dependent hydrolase [Planctomycetia bacterium]
MAGHKTHLTCSTIAGIGLGMSVHCFYGTSISLSILSGCLCSLGGIVPDIDSKTSTSFRQCLGLVSGFSALLLVSRLRDFDFTAETVMIIGSLAFLITWAIFGTLVQRFTRHRGMCHSIPMGLIAAEFIFILSSGDLPDRLLKGGAMFAGFMVHLILDEIYSVQSKGVVGVRLKKSFGTAVKMADFDNLKSTVFIYIILALMTDVVLNEPVWSKDFKDQSVAAENQKGEDLIRIARIKYPMQFNLAVVDWVAQNNLVLEPGTGDNPKWKELQALFEEDNPEKQDNPMRMVSHSAAETPSGKRKLTFLEQINWNSRHNGNNKDANQNSGSPSEGSTGANNQNIAKPQNKINLSKNPFYLLKYL